MFVYQFGVLAPCAICDLCVSAKSRKGMDLGGKGVKGMLGQFLGRSVMMGGQSDILAEVAVRPQ